MVTRYNIDSHHRRSIRLRGYDYSRAGAYFVTICVHDRRPILGTVEEDRVAHTDCGRAVVDCWRWLGERYPHVEIDEWIVMPNHLHGIVVLCDAERDGSRTGGTRRKPLGELIGAFKTVSTQRVNALRARAGEPLWQRDFYEHIIRDEVELDRIRQYIATNPLQWALDRENPAATPKPPDEPWQV
jgi:REP element-mobilizing transposase RayT